MFEKTLGFKPDEITYVWSETVDRRTSRVIKQGKTHAMGVSSEPERYRTLCGIEDVCGFWPFSSLENNIENPDFCGNCRRIIKKLKGYTG